MTENVVEAKNLTVRFNARRGTPVAALDGAGFSLRRGETLSIVGESGSGKSTLLRALLALVRPTSGSVALFGKDLQKLTPDELNKTRRRCGYVPQDPYGALPPGLSVIDAVTEPEVIASIKSTKEERRERAEKLLAEVGLYGERIFAARAVGLSGGQRQRVEIARALALSPELLLCDEPTSMQDASTRGDLIELLKKRAERGASIIFVTHDLPLAAKAAENIIVLKDGKICEKGASRDVLTNPRGEYTKKLIDALPKIAF